MSDELNEAPERKEKAPEPKPAPEEKAQPEEPKAPEGLSDEEFAALREQVRKMYDEGPEETR